MLQNMKRWALLIIVGGGILALDQWVKNRVVETLALGESWTPIPSIANVITITRSANSGAAIGMFPFASDFFLVLAFVTVLIFIFSYPRLPSHAALSRFSMAMITGGALSNAIDRLLRGHVVDYVHVQVGTLISNISNFADHAITLGVILLLIDQWRAEQHEIAEKNAEELAAALIEDEVDSPQGTVPSDGFESNIGSNDHPMITPFAVSDTGPTQSGLTAD
jgi:signal peptidase II